MAGRKERFLLAAIALSGLGAPGVAQTAQSGSSLWHHGTIITMDGPAPHTVKAVVVREGKVVFREPIYWTPRGYKYIYVRGYYWKRLPRPYVERAYRRPIKVTHRVSTHRVRRAPCITDSGFGRYEMCRRYY